MLEISPEMEFLSPEVKPARKMLFTHILKTTPPARAETVKPKSIELMGQNKGKETKRKVPVLRLNLNLE